MAKGFQVRYTDVKTGAEVGASEESHTRVSDAQWEARAYSREHPEIVAEVVNPNGWINSRFRIGKMLYS